MCLGTIRNPAIYTLLSTVIRVFWIFGKIFEMQEVSSLQICSDKMKILLKLFQAFQLQKLEKPVRKLEICVETNYVFDTFFLTGFFQKFKIPFPKLDTHVF